MDSCPYIQELYLGSTHITDNSLNLIATKFILLTHLHLSGCEYISELGVHKVTRECKTLRHIDIKDCYNVLGETGLHALSARFNIELPRPFMFTSDLHEDDQWVDVDEEEEDNDGWEDDPPAYSV